MKVLAVDSDDRAAEALAGELKNVFPKGSVYIRKKGSEAVELAKKLIDGGELLEYLFLDVRLEDMDGVALASALKEIFPRINVIFCTSDRTRALEAFAIYAKGYLIKPISSRDITGVLDAMLPDWRKTPVVYNKDIKVQAFGDFEIFVEGERLIFGRSKAKELLAYLVDRHGSAITTERIASILFPEDNYDAKLKNRVTAVISSLKATLKAAGIEDILVKSWNQLGVDTSKFRCDAYDYENLDAVALNSYRGEYMFGYEWGEYSTATYDNIKKDADADKSKKR